MVIGATCLNIFSCSCPSFNQQCKTALPKEDDPPIQNPQDQPSIITSQINVGSVIGTYSPSPSVSFSPIASVDN